MHKLYNVVIEYVGNTINDITNAEQCVFVL